MNYRILIMKHLKIFILLLNYFLSDKVVHDLRSIYRNSIDEANKFLSIGSTAEVHRESEAFLKALHLSIETYLLHLLHIPLSAYLSIKYSPKDATLNRNVR